MYDEEMRVRTDVPLAPLTTLGLGGAAARMVELEREQDLEGAVRDAEHRAEPIFVLGGGSNVVIADEGFPGLVVRMATRGIEVRSEPEHVIVDVAAGETWDALVARAVDEGWGGIECMSGIPGLVGATPIQNVGAYGQEVRETIALVRAYDRTARAFVAMNPRDCQFAYRTSIFRGSERWIVTSVRFVLSLRREGIIRYQELARCLCVPEGGRAPSRAVREMVIALRRAKGMVLDANDPESSSAGSFFVNPIVDTPTLADIAARAGAVPPSFESGEGRHKIPAAWLVERAGFVKGWGAGRVGVSRKHALALVNRGGATAGELLAFARAVRDGVRAHFGVTLDVEPVLVGCSWKESGL
jgi:UDP-N-acetylmuramate dehydrogenase